jgi:ActR/RegA family two-component response regulator
MIDPSTGKRIGTVMMVSEDEMAARQLAEAMQELALSVEVCTKVSDALDPVSRRKFEAGVIDFSLGNQSARFLEQVGRSASNRTAVMFAITSDSTETALALNAGSVFALQRPLTLESIRNTLKAAYGMIVRERRRYFRHRVSCPARLRRKDAPEIFGKTVNISESGMAFSTSTPLKPGFEGRFNSRCQILLC